LSGIDTMTICNARDNHGVLRFGIEPAYPPLKRTP
jgi:hypothetical protein